MPLTSGTRLGPYEILAPLGSGGMGEVYRARDTRLAREVAIKTLPAAAAHDPERRARFELEARAIAALSHPNVMAIHDVGSDDGVSFAVIELIEGSTLRERLDEGPLTAARSIALAIQIAHGLAAAHDKGIVHRDLKPENLILTPDGRIKILDFGLARREHPDGEGDSSLTPTRALATEPGAVLGTVSYMSPEQVRGQVADARSDLFSLGVVMYEMVSGQRPFRGDANAETMTAILREDPADLARLARDVSPALARIIGRCLEKLPGARFRSAADLAFALEAIATLPSGAHASLTASPNDSARPRFTRITFRNGVVASARFVPNGPGVVFGASWEGRAFEIFTAQPGSPEARSLGLPPANLLAISRTGEMAISLGYRHMFSNNMTGTLARNALSGGGVRPLQKEVVHADWSPDGRSLAIARYVDGHCRLEWPAGQVRFETPYWLSRPRVSRDGKRVAFAHHPFHGDTQGEIRVLAEDGSVKTLPVYLTSVSGIAWSPSDDEVWCSGINEDQHNGIWAIALDGTRREIHTSPGRIWLHDLAPDGRALIGLGSLHLGVSVSPGEGEPEIDLSWFDGTLATDVSPDGRQVLLTEALEAENPHYATYLRSIDGSAAVRLGDGISVGFSPDGEWALATTTSVPQRLILYPVGFGEPREIPLEGLERISWAEFHPAGHQVFVVGSRHGSEEHLFRIGLDGGEPVRVCDEPVAYSRIFGTTVSPDGERVLFRRAGSDYRMLTVATGTSEAVPALTTEETAVRFDASGRFVFLGRGDVSEFRLERVDLATGERVRWRTLSPPDRTGILYMAQPVMTADASMIAYTYCRLLGDLYMVEGLG